MATLATEVEQWLVCFKAKTVKASTYERLKTSLDALKRYSIAEKDIFDVTAEDFQNYLNELVDDGYALTTIKKQYHLLTGYFRFACTEGLIARPFYNNVKLPDRSRIRKQKKDSYGYSPEDQRKLRHVLETREYPGYLAAILMLETGMRVGEVMALSWTDILWNRKAIRISKTLIRLPHQKKAEIQGEAKTHSSNRTIPMSTTANDILTELYRTAVDPNGFIFAREDGSPITYEAMRWQINHACTEAGVEYCGMHIFRHTFASNCYARGCDVKILSKLLGHSDVTITYNLYIHLFGDALEEMRSVLG